MYCRYCGTENKTGENYCKKCGKPLNFLREQAKSLVDANSPAHTASFCPNCGAGLSACVPISKTDVKSSGGGYSFWNGCCGMILLGPFGLLCGLCGRETNTTVQSMTWFVCQRCGAEFSSLQSAIETAVISIRSVALYTLFLSFAITTDWDVAGAMWIRIVCGLIILGLWAGIMETMERSTGLSFEKLLLRKELSSFWARLGAYFIASLLIGLYIGTKL